MTLIERIWFEGHPLRWLLLPLSLLFWIVAALRKILFRLGLKPSGHPGVPVIVVGNISVGGNGKTPVVLKTVEWLLELGYKPGILSRGYGGTCASHPHIVKPNDEATVVGDEPKLMALRGLCPVVIDPERLRGAMQLVEQGCNVIVCDDGLQHYALKRDIEWVVMDDRGVGNGFLLPAGPLRERPARLDTVDAVIHNGTAPVFEHAHPMRLTPRQFINVADTSKRVDVEEFVLHHQNQTLNALAGIGSPQRFFNSLEALGLKSLQCHPFVDHHKFSAADIPKGITLMTEKDAVKCKGFAHESCWYLEVDATLPKTLKDGLNVALNKITEAKQ